ncbi:MAG: TIGR00730 family Rossman fold protein [Xanthobacteraceae bacterium]|nr:TIGR00730 family Rossman fold protein [Xanthobacteraceae bacterium]
MSQIRRICVYCGSGSGRDPDFATAARKLGQTLAKNGIGLVYGGGSVGLMGELANSVLDHGGQVTGIIPEFLANREHMMRRGKLVRVRDMHERKQQMFDHADAFVALPGGIGTLEEVVEQMTWAQLGRHQKPILLANIKGFWDPLLRLFEHMDQMAFIHSANLFKYYVADAIDDVLPTLAEAAAQSAEAQKAMAPEVAGRM